MEYSRASSVRIEKEGNHLHLRWSVEVPMPVGQVRPRLQAYFSKLGYTSAAAGEGLRMRRGSLLRSMLIWTPRNLAAELTVRCTPAGEGTQVALELTVDKTGHWIYKEDCDLLATELVEAERFLLGEQVDLAAMDALNRHTSVQLIYVILITFVFTLPLVVVALGLRILMREFFGIDRGLARMITTLFIIFASIGIFMLVCELKLGRRRF